MYVAAEGFLVGECVRHGLTDHHYIAHHRRHAAPAEEFGTLRHQIQIHAAIGAESGNRLAIVGVEGVEKGTALHQDAAIIALAPVGDAAGARAGQSFHSPVWLLHPDRGAGTGVECLHESDAIRHIADAVLHDRRGCPG